MYKSEILQSDKELDLVMFSTLAKLYPCNQNNYPCGPVVHASLLYVLCTLMTSQVLLQHKHHQNKMKQEKERITYGVSLVKTVILSSTLERVLVNSILTFSHTSLCFYASAIQVF